MSQYAIYYQGEPVEYTGYFKSVRGVRTYLRLRYSDLSEITFRAVYPVVQEKVYAAI